MSYFQKHLKTVTSENQEPLTKNITHSQVAHKFKKNMPNRSKVSQANNTTVQETIRANRKAEHEEALTEYNPKQTKPTRRQQPKPFLKSKAQKGVGGQLATQKQVCQGDSMSRELQTLMMQADNSMEQLLNSSINQFTRYLEDKDSKDNIYGKDNTSKDNIYEQHHQLVEQNNYLRTSLDELKNILKSKLENSLQKQKEELTLMMEDYIKLITKLLKDKEDLTLALEKLEEQLKANHARTEQLNREAHDSRDKIEELTRDKDHHINKTKKQIDDFLQIIEQYEEEAEHEGKEGEQMRARIEELELQLKKYQDMSATAESTGGQPLNKKLLAQNNKIQTLIELLERSQEENKQLRQSLHKISQSDDKLSQLQKEYRERLQQMEREHEQEFMEYERAVRQTINQKDECIERLNSILGSYRAKGLHLQFEGRQRQKLI